MRFFILIALALSACASQSDELSGNEAYLRRNSEKFYEIYCWNLRSARGAKPFLTFTVQGPRRIAGLKFPAAQQEYLDYEIPFENERYGPFPGEEITAWTSPYKTGSDFKVTDGFTVILPVLTHKIGAETMGNDRESNRKNGYVEIRPRNHGLRTSVDLHCEAD